MTNVPARRPARLLPLASMALALAACQSGGPSTGPTASPGGSGGPTSTPGSSTTGAIEHLTGASDLILRVEEGGGMLPISMTAIQAPPFSLYGDGTAIFRDPTTSPPVADGPITRGIPFAIVRLNEDQVQTLLEFALGQGALGIARATYELPIMDAGTTTFTLNAGGLRKTVSVNGLGLDVPNTPDTAVLRQLVGLRARLQGFAAEVGGEQPWLPDHYRGILTSDAFGPPAAWPWTSIAPADFTSTNPQGLFVATRVMTPAEIGELGISGFEGGAQGWVFASPTATGGPFSFGFRPILPDDQP